MALTLDIKSDIARLTADLRTASARSESEQRAAVRRASVRLLAIMRQQTHVQTGRMRASEIVEGPFPIGQGVIEATIGPTVEYAIEEIKRGDLPSGSHPEGGHDYRQRTLDAGDTVFDDLANELVNAIL